MEGSMTELLSALRSPDNRMRADAEAAFGRAKEADINSVAAGLVGALRAESEPVNRAMAAVLLRRVVDAGDKSGGAWKALAPEAQAEVRSQCLAAFDAEPTPVVARSIAHVIAQLAQSTGVERWPEVVPSVFALAVHEHPRRREIAYFLMNILCEFCWEGMHKGGHLPGLHEAFGHGMADEASGEVRAAALAAAVSCINTLDAKETLDAFADLLPTMFGVLLACLRDDDELAAREVLQSLIDMARVNATFLRSVLEDAAQAMLEISAKGELDADTRKLAMELLLTVCEQAPSMVRKSAVLINATLPLAMQLICELVEDDAWGAIEYNAMLADADAEDETCAAVGEAAVYRIGKALGGAAVLPVAFELVPEYLAAAEWQKRRAGLVTIAMVGEGCAKAMRPRLDVVVDMVTPRLRDDHPRVKHAAITACGAMATDFSDKWLFQRGFGDQVLPLLAEVIADAGMPSRVRAHAATSVVNFCGTEDAPCPPQPLEPHMDALLGGLVGLLGGDVPMATQSQALNAVACLARVAKDRFVPYYEHFMPGLKGIIMATADAAGGEARVVRGHAMQCVGHLAEAVGADTFMGDAKEIMDTLMAAFGGGLPVEDPQTRFVVEAICRVCKVIGEACVPYLPLIIEPLLASAARDPEVSVTDVGPGEDIAPGGGGDDEEEGRGEGVSSVTLEWRGMTSKKFSVNTSALEEIAMAVRTLFEYAEDLKALFYPYVQRVAEVTVPLVTFQWNHAVRYSAACSAPRLLQSYIEGLRAEPGRDVAEAQPLMEAMLDALMRGMQTEHDVDTRVAVAEAFKEVLAACRDSGADGTEPEGATITAAPRVCVRDEHLADVTKCIFAVAGQSIERRQGLQASLEEDEDADEAAAEALDEAFESEEELMTNLVDALGNLIKACRDRFMPTFEAVVAPAMGPLMAPDSGAPPALRVNALCPFVDVVEYCGPAAHKYAGDLLPVLLAGIRDEAAPVRQVCAYGFAACLQHVPEMAAPMVPAAVAALLEVVSAEDADDEDERFATENCVSALGKITEAVGAGGAAAGVDESAVWPVWLGKLPLREDEEEAQYCHGLLCRLVSEGNPYIMGEGNANLPQVLGVMGAVLVGCEGGGDSDISMADGETCARMAGLIKSMQASVDAAAFGAAWAALDEAQQAAITMCVGAVGSA